MYILIPKKFNCVHVSCVQLIFFKQYWGIEANNVLVLNAKNEHSVHLCWGSTRPAVTACRFLPYSSQGRHLSLCVCVNGHLVGKRLWKKWGKCSKYGWTELCFSSAVCWVLRFLWETTPLKIVALYIVYKWQCVVWMVKAKARAAWQYSEQCDSRHTFAAGPYSTTL